MKRYSFPGHIKTQGDRTDPEAEEWPRGRHRPVLRTRRAEWRTPRLDTLQRPVFTLPRKVGLLTLRGYIVFAIVIMTIKLAQVAAH